MKSKIPFSYQDFVDELGRAIDEEAKHGAQVVDTIEIKPEEKLDFATVRAEAQKLWVDLIQKNEENAAIILKKIEMIFGRKIKMSEITEDQVDLMQLVVLDMREMLEKS